MKRGKLDCYMVKIEYGKESGDRWSECAGDNPEMQRTNDASMCVQESWRETRERIEKVRDKESRKAIIGCIFSELHKLEEGCE